jgi:mRNA interferase MazF
MVSVIRRGDIWLADFGDPVGREQGYVRPGVIVSTDAFNRARTGLVMAVPTTTTKCGWPTHVEIDTHTGLKETSYALVEQLRATSTERLIRQIGAADPSTMNRIIRVIREVLKA